MKIPRGIPVEREHTRALAALTVVRRLRQRHARAPRQKFHRVREREVFYLHYEVYHAAALAAAEAVECLPVGRDGEGRGLFAVERAQPKKV